MSHAPQPARPRAANPAPPPIGFKPAAAAQPPALVHATAPAAHPVPVPAAHVTAPAPAPAAHAPLPVPAPGPQASTIQGHVPVPMVHPLAPIQAPAQHPTATQTQTTTQQHPPLQVNTTPGASISRARAGAAAPPRPKPSFVPATPTGSVKADVLGEQRTTPVFILDLEPGNVAHYGRWRIRRWADALKDYQQDRANRIKNKEDVSNMPEDLPYGIVSYAWGDWHDRSQHTLGGYSGSPNPNNYPTFDIGETQVASFKGPDLHNKAYPRDQGQEIPAGEPLTWVFPVLRVQGRSHDATSAPFDIDEVYNALVSLVQSEGIRYVWWDQACIPQGWDRDFWKGGDPTPPNVDIHNDLKKVKEVSANSMRLFYPRSTVGALWWHQSAWNPAQVPPTLRQPPWAAHGAPAVAAAHQPVQDLLNSIYRMSVPIAQIANAPDSSTTQRLLAQITYAQVDEFRNNLILACARERSLTSLWSFQEGVLFGSTRREMLDKKRPSLLLDRHGNELPMLLADGHSAPGFSYPAANLQDITSAATVVASMIIPGLMGNRKTVNQAIAAAAAAAPAAAAAAAAAPHPDTSFVEWCSAPGNEAAVRTMLSELLNTGLLGYSYNSPLALMEAKFGRRWQPYQDPMDVKVYTIMGALAVDIDWRSTKVKTAQEFKAQMVAKGIADTGQVAEAHKAAFLQSLFDIYQWRLLFFARGDEFHSKTELVHANSNSTPETIWSKLLADKRPSMAPLDLCLGQDRILRLLYGPDRARASHNNVVPGLPQLDLPNENLLAAIIDPKTSTAAASTGYTIHHITPDDEKGWESSVCYKYVPGPPTAAASQNAATVAAVDVPFGSRKDFFPPGDILLLPILQDLPPGGGFQPVAQVGAPGAAPGAAPAAAARQAVNTNVAATWARMGPAADRVPTVAVTVGSARTKTFTCAIVVKYDATDNMGVFWGIGDFTGLGTGEKLARTLSLY